MADEHGQAPPGTDPRPRVGPRRFVPRFHYELIGCGLGGHQLLGTDVATIRPADQQVVREPGDGLRWHRCVRCDAWVPLPIPAHPSTEHLPDRADITLPLRGRPLRDRYVLRLIALDRLVHFLVLAALAAAVFVFAADRAALSQTFYKVLDAVQGDVGGPSGQSGGLLGELEKAFAASGTTLLVVGLVLAGYALLEGIEAVGLWWAKRWAEYLTLVATAVLLIPEVYELTESITATKIIAMIINIAVVVYLLFAKRLFGLRGGGRAEEAERERDTGWAAIDRALPVPSATTAATTPLTPSSS